MGKYARDRRAELAEAAKARAQVIQQACEANRPPATTPADTTTGEGE